MKKWFLAIILSSLALAGCKEKEEGAVDKKENGTAQEQAAEPAADTGASLNAIQVEKLAMAEDAAKAGSMDVDVAEVPAMDAEAAPVAEGATVEIDQAKEVVDIDDSDDSDSEDESDTEDQSDSADESDDDDDNDED